MENMLFSTEPTARKKKMINNTKNLLNLEYAFGYKTKPNGESSD